MTKTANTFSYNQNLSPGILCLAIEPYTCIKSHNRKTHSLKQLDQFSQDFTLDLPLKGYYQCFCIIKQDYRHAHMW